MLSNNNPSSSSADRFNSTENANNASRRKRRPAGTPDPDAEVVSLSPKTLLESDRYICEICNQGFQRDQNVQMHRRRHKFREASEQKDDAALLKLMSIYGEEVVTALGSEVDRLEKEIQEIVPGIRHVDIEAHNPIGPSP